LLTVGIPPDEQVPRERPRLSLRPLDGGSRRGEVAERDVEGDEPGEHRGVRAETERDGARVRLIAGATGALGRAGAYE